MNYATRRDTSQLAYRPLSPNSRLTARVVLATTNFYSHAKSEEYVYQATFTNVVRVMISIWKYAGHLNQGVTHMILVWYVKPAVLPGQINSHFPLLWCLETLHNHTGSE